MERRNLSIPLEERDGEMVYSRCRMFNVNYSQVISEYLFLYIGVLSGREYINDLVRFNVVNQSIEDSSGPVKDSRNIFQDSNW